MKDKKYRRGLQSMDVEKDEKQTSSSEKSLESNEMDYGKFEDIYDPILSETEATTHLATINKNLDYEEREEEIDNEEDDEASVFSKRLWNSFLQKIKS